MHATTSFVSLGRIAQDLQIHVDEIRRAADELDIAPSFTLNGIQHFDESDVSRIAQHLRNVAK